MLIPLRRTPKLSPDHARRSDARYDANTISMSSIRIGINVQSTAEVYEQCEISKTFISIRIWESAAISLSKLAIHYKSRYRIIAVFLSDLTP